MANPAIFDSAMAGLRSAQAGLLATSQNVAGSSVEGYVRRRPDIKVSALASTSVEVGGSSFAVEGFARFYDGLLQSQLLSQQGRTRYSETLNRSVGTLDSVIADPSTSIATKLGEFFNAAGSLANDSSNAAYQQAFLGSARETADRIRVLSSELDRLSNYSKEALANVLNDANSLMPQLAAINGKIKGAYNPGFSYPSADLLDQRDRLTQRLSELLGAQTIINDDGSANVMVGGLQLVDRDLSNKFTNSSGTTPVLAPNDVNSLRLQSASPAWGQPKLLEFISPQKSNITEGEAGAFIHLLSSFAPTVKKGLNLLTANLVRSVNSVRSQASQYTYEGQPTAAIGPPGANAITLNAAPGGAIVNGQRLYINGIDQNVRVTGVVGNTVNLSGLVTVGLTDEVGFKLPELNLVEPVFGFRAQSSGENYVSNPSDLDRIFQRSEGHVVTLTRASGGGVGANSFAVTSALQGVQGLQIYVRQSGALFDTGQTVQDISGTVLTASGAMNLPAGVSLQDSGIQIELIPQTTANFVAAHPTSGSLSTIELTSKPFGVDIDGSQIEYNDGSGWRSAGRVVYTDGPLVVYEPSAGANVSATNQVRFFRDHTFTDLLDRFDPKSDRYDPTREQRFLGQVNASVFQLVTDGGPEFFSKLDAGSARLIEARRSEAATSTGVVVMSVANTIATWRSEGEANSKLLQVITDQKESVSGVSLDEEAANLIKYQQLYGAASKLLQAGRQMFDTLLAALIT